MALGERDVSKSSMRVVAVLMLGIGLSACSTIPSWVDPTTWLGPDVPDEGQADNGQYPDLSNMPERPAPASTSDEQQQVASSLAAARDNAQYSAEALRGGTEAAAPPPGPAAPAAQVARAERAAAPSEAGPPPSAEPKAAPVTEVASAAEPAPAAARPSSGEPAVPAVPAYTTQSMGGIPGLQPAVPSDASLGFQPSRAPALDASVAQFVPQPIIARYAQTASIAAPAVPAGSMPALRAPRGMRPPAVGTGETDVGGPEAMSGAVVADLGALESPSAVQASVYASPSGLPPVAVVLFPHDTTALDATGREQVRAAVDAYQARGGQGYIRVVGHSSSRTGDMSYVAHMELNFRKSQQRAAAVAKALISAGIPAKKVLVEAVGDSQPVYYESMPKGEDGNRRAEIFVQG